MAGIRYKYILKNHRAKDLNPLAFWPENGSHVQAIERFAVGGSPCLVV